MNKFIFIILAALIASVSSFTHADIVEASDLGITKVEVIREATPVYPFEARKKRQDAEVVLSYDVNKYGRAVNIQVVEASGSGKFAIAAKRAMKQTVFEAQTVDGKPVVVSGLMKRYKFEIVDLYSLADASVKVSDL